MSRRQRGWCLGVVAAALYLLALARDTSCGTTDGVAVAVGTLGGWGAFAFAVRLLVFGRPKSHFGNASSSLAVWAASVALAFIPTLAVGGTASSLETDYCCTPHGCR
jgi:hypothetical protein